MKKALLTALLILGVADLAFADSKKTVEVNGRFYTRHTKIDLDTDTISGDLTKPDGEYFDLRTKGKLTSLLVKRPHFRERIKHSINEL